MIRIWRINRMRKIIAVLCLSALLLTACGGGEAAPEVSDTLETTVSETETALETQSESVSETVGETETETETESETETETETEAETEAVADPDEYKAVYKEKLEEFKNEEYSNHPAFDLFDMDNDGVPELFMSHDDYHAAGVFAYSFKNGRFVDLSVEGFAYGSYGEAMVSSDGYLRSEYAGMGGVYDTYYRINGDRLEEILYTEMHEIPNSDDWDNCVMQYMVNDEEVTEEEYNAAYEKFNAYTWVSVGRGNPIDDETIEAVLYSENVSQAETEPEAPAKSEDYKTLYNDFLTEITKWEDYDLLMDDPPSELAFELIDLDSDGTPELFFSKGKFHQTTVKVYTVTDGAVSEIEDPSELNYIAESGGFGASGVAMVSKDGMICNNYSGMGAEHYEYFKFENGALSRLDYLEHYSWYPDSGDYEYGLNGSEVTEAEYNEALEKYTSAEWFEAGRKYLLTEENINEVLS